MVFIMQILPLRYHAFCRHIKCTSAKFAWYAEQYNQHSDNRIPNSNCVIMGHVKETEIALISIIA